MVTFCLFVCLLLREEMPILAHTFQWAAALKWVADQANTPLPSLFSFTVTVFFAKNYFWLFSGVHGVSKILLLPNISTDTTLPMSKVVCIVHLFYFNRAQRKIS